MGEDEEQEAVKLARDLCTETLHGAPPVVTTMRIAAALVAMSEELDQARKERDEARRMFGQVGDILIYTEKMIGAELSNENLTRGDGTQTLPLPDNWRELVAAWAEEGE